jgi:hypothetical protein
VVVVSMGEVSAVAVSTGGSSAVAVSTAAVFVVAVSITGSLMTSSSAATVIRGGGAGVIRTDIMVTTITRTVTMDTADIRMAMDTAGTVTTVALVMDIAMAVDLTCAVVPFNQVAQCIANTNHGVM